MESIKFTIGFGCLCESIAKQLRAQGLKFNIEKVRGFERSKNYITHLRFAEILNDSQHEKAIKKLFTQIRRHIMQRNKLKILSKGKRIIETK
jgi:hypothetical protein